MSHRRSTFLEVGVALAVTLHGGAAAAQACCAGSGLATPGRLGLHEIALVGAQARTAFVTGSYDPSGRHAPPPAGASELDLEQDVFGSVRVLEKAQLSLLVPFVETRRTSRGQQEFGGGLGDINAGARVDLTSAGQRRFVPGIALLAGLTLPTGRPADAKGLGALATGATGIGAFQVTGGAAVEQSWGAWLVSLSGYVAQRTSRTVGIPPAEIHEHLGAQWTALATVAYTTRTEVSVGISASYTFEGNATVNGDTLPGTARRLPLLTLAGALPLTDHVRLQGSIFDSPQVSGLGKNQPSTVGLLVTLVLSWT